METIYPLLAAVFAAGIFLTWLLTRLVLSARHAEAKRKLESELIRRESEIGSLEKELQRVKDSAEERINAIKETQKEAIEAARTALALENQNTLKQREDSLKAEAKENFKTVADSINDELKELKKAISDQKTATARESESIRTKFKETVDNLRDQTQSVSATAESLAAAFRGQNKMQGIFGETILENILKAEGLREGRDYESEYWIRDAAGNISRNESSGAKMRPDFVLHFPDDTDVLLDSKVSLGALADYFAAQTDARRDDAARRNLDSVRTHIKELSAKEYQKYITGKNTLDYVLMFIPNYGAWQLAKQLQPDIFSEAFSKGVLVTTEETLIPFLRLIRTAWAHKEQIENIDGIIDAAKRMVDRVALYCEESAKMEGKMSDLLKNMQENNKRLVSGRQSIAGAAREVVERGVPQGKRILPADKKE